MRLEGAGDNGAYNTFFPPSTDLGNLYRSVGATGVDIGGTITYLGDATETIKKTVESFHFVDQKQMNQELRPILEQIKNIQADVLPKLELAKNTITNVEEFLKDNVTFLTNSIEVKGRLQLIESNLNSFSTRIDTLEKNKNIKWNQSATIATIVVAIFSLFSLVVAYFFLIYIAFR